MNIYRMLNNKFGWTLNPVLILLLSLVLSGMADVGKAADAESEKLIAVGDGFELTQKNVAAFQDLFNANKAVLQQKEVVATALKYELLFREYRKNHRGSDASDLPEDGLAAARLKMRDSEIYIQEMMQRYVISSAVIESYYRSHPEKYGRGKTPGGNIDMMPLDDNLKNEITFIIVEAKKETIVKETVDGLIAKYHIQVQDGL
ncbi:MAG: hypothetical protein V1844_03550 [Pseudomonadota bacterium]